jgi:hypothetical protein
MWKAISSRLTPGVFAFYADKGYNSGMAKKKSAKRPVGRPSDYDKSVLDKAMKYINGGFAHSQFNEVIPCTAGLARWLEISSTTLFRWGQEKEEFRDILNILKDVQHVIALNGGASGKMNAMIISRVLAKHGYTDKQEIDMTSSDKSMTPTRAPIDASKLSPEALAELTRLYIESNHKP